MKHQRLRGFFLCWAISLFTGVSCMTCLITAFDLSVAHLDRLLLLCGAVSLAGTFLFSRKNGEPAALCLLAAAAGFLWYGEVFPRQATMLIVRVGNLWDEAYHWGGFVVPEFPPYVDYPVAALTVLLIVLVCRSISGRKSSAAPVFLSLLILLLCMASPDTAPAPAPLALLMAELALLVLTGSVRRESAAQGSRLTVAIALPVLLLTGLLIAVLPRSGYTDRSGSLRGAILTRLQQIPGLIPEETGVPPLSPGELPRPRVDLSALTGQDDRGFPVMEVLAPKTETLYLRGQDYDTYTRTGWESTPDRSEEFSGWGAGEQITLRTCIPHQVLYLPYYPEGSTLLSQGMARNTQHLQQYTLTRCPMGSMADPDTLSRCLTLPESTAAALKPYLPGEAPDTETTANRIAALVRAAAPYDRATGKMPEEEPDFVLWFLERAETGYCVHFASASVALLRAAGIPARYVTGYKAEALAGETVTVTSRDAHAWAEYYDSEQGCWRVLESTPAEGGTAQPVQTVPSATDAPPVPQPEEVTTPTEPPAQISEEKDSGPLWGLLLLPAAALLLILQRYVRLLLRRRMQQRGTVNRQALRLWQEAEVFARLLKEPPPEQLSRLAEKALFSQHTLTPEELTPFREYRSRSIRRLRKAPWYFRLLYRYIYAVC